MSFEETGLFLSFISYPFYVDGKNLYNTTLRSSFIEHKKALGHYDPSAENDDSLYVPAAYRMFGSHGLVVMSLVDDYNFFHRHFNKNHLQTLLKNQDNTVFDYNSVIVSGVTESNGESLEQKAKKSFLLQEKKFPYIGIIRIKVDHRVLRGEGHGMVTLRKIKDQIDFLATSFLSKWKCCAKHITIECFNNDELTTIAFSDSLFYLFDFLGKVRGIKNTDDRIKQDYIDSSNTDGTNNPCEKHMFGTTYMSFGYDVDYHFNKENENENFILAKAGELDQLKINCVVETKPGHCDVFANYLEKETTLEVEHIVKNISGGCSIVATMPLKNISKLEELCLKPQDDKSLRDSVFLCDVRKIKVSIASPNGMEKCTVEEDNHNLPADDKDPIDEKYISEVKELLKRIGVSKMLRERMLALFELYNRAYKDLLQRFFLDELRPIIKDYYNMLNDMYERGDSIAEIEDAMNDEITNMENACFDRLHSDKHHAAPLEYNGGIQQHLTSLDFAYKSIRKAFGLDKPKTYVTVTGAHRAASERPLFMLNINDVVFPELFITAVWKEVANFAIELLRDDAYSVDVNINDNYKQHIKRLLTGWSKFVQSDESAHILQYHLTHSDSYLSTEKVFRIVSSFDFKELLQYFCKDYIVYQFAFQTNFEMMWHFYFKVMLQTTACYRRLNEIESKHLVYMLLRLFMVGLLSDDENDRKFIEKQASVPFDSLLASDWIECYGKTWKVAENMYDTLQQYDFKGINNTLAYLNELFIIAEKVTKNDEEKTDVEIRSEGFYRRGKLIDEMKTAFEANSLVIAENDIMDTDFVICLFSTYLRCLIELDQHNNVVKSLPRNNTGAVVDNLAIEDTRSKPVLFENMTGLLSDITGGFFVPSSATRKRYFQLKTTLYKSLWHHRFTHAQSESEL